MIRLTAILLVASHLTPIQVNTGWWNGWEFGARVHLHPTIPGSTLVVKGISNDECMQLVEDDQHRAFHLSYQHRSPDGFQCEERWCLRESQSITSVKGWGSAIWQGVHHSISVTEFPEEAEVDCK